MKIKEGKLADSLVIQPEIYGDDRGFFQELWSDRSVLSDRIGASFVQDNLSRSSRGVLRGLHFQNPKPQAKLIHVLDGEILDVIVDLRQSSPTFGQWESYLLNGKNRTQVFIPRGFAHGFAVLSKSALFSYKCNEFYYPEHERTLSWNDPGLGINWQLNSPQLSEKDQLGKSFEELNSSGELFS